MGSLTDKWQLQADLFIHIFASHFRITLHSQTGDLEYYLHCNDVWSQHNMETASPLVSRINYDTENTGQHTFSPLDEKLIYSFLQMFLTPNRFFLGSEPATVDLCFPSL